MPVKIKSCHSVGSKPPKSMKGANRASNSVLVEATCEALKMQSTCEMRPQILSFANAPWLKHYFHLHSNIAQTTTRDTEEQTKKERARTHTHTYTTPSPSSVSTNRNKRAQIRTSSRGTLQERTCSRPRSQWCGKRGLVWSSKHITP